MADELDWQIDTWAAKGPGWSGPWRRVYMPAEVERRSKLIALHDLHRYSKAWCDAVTHPPAHRRHRRSHRAQRRTAPHHAARQAP